MKNKLVGYICALLMLALVVLQFMPYWNFQATVKNKETKQNEEVEMNVSIQQYVWLPEDNKDCTKFLQAETGDSKFAAGNIIAFPVLALIVSAVGIVFILINPEFKFIFLFPMIVGIVGLICLNTQVAFSKFTGFNYTSQLVLCAVLTLLGIARLVFVVKDIAKNWK